MCYKNLGNICYVTFFWGGPCSTQNQVGEPRATALLAHANDHHCYLLNKYTRPENQTEKIATANI